MWCEMKQVDWTVQMCCVMGMWGLLWLLLVWWLSHELTPHSDTQGPAWESNRRTSSSNGEYPKKQKSPCGWHDKPFVFPGKLRDSNIYMWSYIVISLSQTFMCVRVVWWMWSENWNSYAVNRRDRSTKKFVQTGESMWSNIVMCWNSSSELMLHSLLQRILVSVILGAFGRRCLVKKLHIVFEL